MGNSPARLRIHSFGSGDPLHQLKQTSQVTYLIDYFGDLGAASIVEEKNYFDRDYLAEFSAFYGISSKGYPNVCRRIHVFSKSINRATIRSGAAGSEKAIRLLNESYLGFVVLRPIAAAPLGRTVVVWYPENNLSLPRVTQPARQYCVHIAGITLHIRGLAWQQQDSGVGACATVGLWTMLHSSAFDDHHAIPTTAQITRDAHSTASLGSRVFPSKGLTIYQICEAIKANGLAPMVFEGDITGNNATGVVGFSRERFSAACASLIRSGYPVLVIGDLAGAGGHAVCAVGFRSCAPADPAGDGSILLQESNVEYIYIHDDNIGPNVRFGIQTDPHSGVVRLERSPPPPIGGVKRFHNGTYPPLVPNRLVVAVHEDLRTSPDQLHKCGLLKTSSVHNVLATVLKAGGRPPIPLSFSSRFMKLSDYVGSELANTLGSNQKLLGRVRLNLWEHVPPMSLHIGVLRIGLWNSTPIVDVLYDTTDSDRNHPVFAHIAYADFVCPIAKFLSAQGDDFGECVVGFDLH